MAPSTAQAEGMAARALQAQLQPGMALDSAIGLLEAPADSFRRYEVFIICPDRDLSVRSNTRGQYVLVSREFRASGDVRVRSRQATRQDVHDALDLVRDRCDAGGIALGTTGYVALFLDENGAIGSSMILD
jgi:hypothetical protein